MVHLMDYKHSSKVMDDLRAFILTIPQVDRCTNEEVEEWTNKLKNILSVFDGIFSIARMSCGTVKEEHIESIINSINSEITLWRGLGNSVSPKPHALEDHLVDQLLSFSGIGDFC